jgi:uncharacterized protein
MSLRWLTNEQLPTLSSGIMIDKKINALKAGIGLRAPHYRALQALAPDIAAPGFLEVHSENFFGEGGQPLQYLTWFRERYPLSLHGVGLSIGSADGLNTAHLTKLKRLVDRFQPTLVSEHLCWVGVNGQYANDLLPLPYTANVLAHVSANIARVQEYLQRPILIENVSGYLSFATSDIPECEFVARLAESAGCQILLDINNIYVNSVNHQFNPYAYIDTIRVGSVGEMHLAGFQDTGDGLIDTHGAPVSAAVWDLYRYALKRFGAVPTLIEWDTDIPALDVLLAEATQATSLLEVSCAQ